MMQAFNSLATEFNLRSHMLEQGEAPAVIALAISSHNRMLRGECVETLCKLAVIPGSEAQIMAEVCIVLAHGDTVNRLTEYQLPLPTHSETYVESMSLCCSYYM